MYSQNQAGLFHLFSFAFRQFVFIAIFCLIVLIIAIIVLVKVIQMRLNNGQAEAELASNGMWNELVETHQPEVEQVPDEDDEDLEDAHNDNSKYYVRRS
mgnify:CR=1 FL=1